MEEKYQKPHFKNLSEAIKYEKGLRLIATISKAIDKIDSNILAECYNKAFKGQDLIAAISGVIDKKEDPERLVESYHRVRNIIGGGLGLPKFLEAVAKSEDWRVRLGLSYKTNEERPNSIINYSYGCSLPKFLDDIAKSDLDLKSGISLDYKTKFLDDIAKSDLDLKADFGYKTNEERLNDDKEDLK